MINSYYDATKALDSLLVYSPGKGAEGSTLYGFVMRDPVRRESYYVTKYAKHFLVFWFLPGVRDPQSREMSAREAAHFVFSNRLFFNNAERFRAYVSKPHFVGQELELFGAAHES